MPADGVHLLEWGDAGPAEEALLVRGVLAGRAVGLEGDAPAVKLDEFLAAMLVPRGFVVNGEVDVLGRGVVLLVAPELGPVAVELEDGFFVFLDGDGLVVEVGDGVEPTTGGDVLAEVVGDVFGFADMAFAAPALDGGAPRADGDRRGIDGLVVEDVLHALDAGHLRHRFPPKWARA